MTSTNLCRLFSLAEIQSATNNFDDELVIGQGGYGKVYKGRNSDEEGGHFVAIKRLDSMSNQGELEFRAEIDMLSTLRHCHLVSLIGYCRENEEMILVYQYMSNGTLFHHLHKATTPLSWLTRLKIALGAARALDYLHTGIGTTHGVIHRDVKSSNILLDENWAAMISDFGLSKIGPTNQLISYVDASVKGTFGYLDPEYFYTRKLTRKTDVYAFGVVLFELLSGRLPVDERYGEDLCSLVRWAQKCVKEGKLDQMVDSNIKGTISPKCLRRFAQIAHRCVHSVLKERPTMTEVVSSLHAILELQEKSNHSAESSSKTGFTWKMHKYFVSTTKADSDQSGTSSPMTPVNNTYQHEELANGYVKVFTYEELISFTRYFAKDTFLGEGRNGKTYKGRLNNSDVPIVVKKLRCYKLVSPEMQFDTEILKKFHHPNLVKLIGYCLEGEQLFLVYEFMHKGNFNSLRSNGVIAGLPLVTKVKIAVGIARGIFFLQEPQFNQKQQSLESWLARASGSDLHRHNILLDKDFTAKLSDYDVSLIVDGGYDKTFPDIDGTLVLTSNLSGYEIIFVEVLTGVQIYSSGRVEKINCLFRQCGKESLRHMARLCFEKCNEVDSESKMVTMLQEHDKLIRSQLKSWLSDRHN